MKAADEAGASSPKRAAALLTCGSRSNLRQTGLALLPVGTPAGCHLLGTAGSDIWTSAPYSAS